MMYDLASTDSLDRTHISHILEKEDVDGSLWSETTDSIKLRDIFFSFQESVWKIITRLKVCFSNN